MNLPIESKALLRRKVLLSNYTTMQVGGGADYFAEPATEEDLLEVLDFANKERLPYVVIGKGSNVIFPDEGYRGLVISFLRYEPNQIEFNMDDCWVSVSGGIHLYRLATACRDAGFSGTEFLASIPGTVGGAVIMNAGYSRFPGQTNEIGDLIREVTAITPGGIRKSFAKDELTFSYRSSNLQGHIVIKAKLQLWRRKAEDVDREIRANFQYRNNKQDLRHPSSGSVFKNPPKPLPAAGELIDKLGLKGTRIGGIMVSPKHGNYFIKVDTAKSSDVIQLINLIQKKVLDATQISLEPEVRIIENN